MIAKKPIYFYYTRMEYERAVSMAPYGPITAGVSEKNPKLFDAYFNPPEYSNYGIFKKLTVQPLNPIRPRMAFTRTITQKTQGHVSIITPIANKEQDYIEISSGYETQEDIIRKMSQIGLKRQTPPTPHRFPHYSSPQPKKTKVNPTARVLEKTKPFNPITEIPLADSYSDEEEDWEENPYVEKTSTLPFFGANNPFVTTPPRLILKPSVENINRLTGPQIAPSVRNNTQIAARNNTQRPYNPSDDVVAMEDDTDDDGTVAVMEQTNHRCSIPIPEITYDTFKADNNVFTESRNTKQYKFPVMSNEEVQYMFAVMNDYQLAETLYDKQAKLESSVLAMHPGVFTLIKTVLQEGFYPYLSFNTFSDACIYSKNSLNNYPEVLFYEMSSYVFHRAIPFFKIIIPQFSNYDNELQDSAFINRIQNTYRNNEMEFIASITKVGIGYIPTVGRNKNGIMQVNKDGMKIIYAIILDRATRTFSATQMPLVLLNRTGVAQYSRSQEGPDVEFPFKKIGEYNYDGNTIHMQDRFIKENNDLVIPQFITSVALSSIVKGEFKM